MKQHEREFFISLIRSGNIYINNKVNLVIKPPTLEQSFESCQIYNDSYQRSYIDGIMSEDEMLEWMIEKDLWSPHDDKTIESLKKDIEKLKVEIYNARNDKNTKERIRLYIRAAEKQIAIISSKKYSYMQNTREGIASSDKISWLIKNTTFYNKKLYKFQELSLSYVVDEWQSSFLSDSICRELARNEPWKSLWTIKGNNIKLFANKSKYELTYNQKNLLIWSQMYDNIQESLECPSKDVVDDDDLLDGWFIIQNKKREKESAEREVESLVKNNKIKNSSEIFVIAKDEDHANKIELANNPNAKFIKKQRSAYIQQQVGPVDDHNLPDQRLQISAQQTNMARGKFKGG